MKSRITLLMSVFLIGFLLSCDSLEPAPEIDSTELSLEEDEIISLKSGEEFEQDEHAAMAAGHHMGMGGHFGHGESRNDCATVTVSGDGFPKEITIDFGDGCQTRKGDLKTGKILITLSDTLVNAGAVHQVEYVDVMIGDKRIDLLKTRTNTGLNATGNWVLESASELTITYADGSSSTRSSNETIEWISGFETADREDNIMYKSGAGTGLNSKGESFERTITTPLLIDKSCDYIKSGVVEMSKDGVVSSIDFGDGTCDQWATITKDGVSKEIDLSRKGKKGKGLGKGR